MVKSEVFGTRPSIISSYLRKIRDFTILKDLWFVTCIRSINPDVKTRYLLVREISDKNKLLNADMSVLRLYFKDYISMWTVFISLGNNEVYLKEKSSVKKLNLNELKKQLLKVTNCKYLQGKGVTTIEASSFSQFFRSEMGNGYSLTDIDFMILTKKTKKLIIIEEKTFVSNRFGLIGFGQYQSFIEIYHDALKNLDSIKWYIAFVENSNVYLYDVISKKLPRRIPEYYPGWGKMIRIPLKETLKKSLNDFIAMLRNIDYT